MTDLPKCRMCGRALKNPESVRLGIGPVCLMREIGQRTSKKSALHSLIIPRLISGVEEVEKE